MEAFSCGTVGIDDFMLVEEHMDVGHLATLILCDSFAVNEVFGCNKDLRFSEQQLGAVALKQHTMLGRDEDVAFQTGEHAGADANGGEFADGMDGSALDPANGLEAVVSGYNEVAHL